MVSGEGGHHRDSRQDAGVTVGMSRQSGFGRKHKLPPLRWLTLRSGRDDRIYCETNAGTGEQLR